MVIKLCLNKLFYMIIEFLGSLKLDNVFITDCYNIEHNSVGDVNQTNFSHFIQQLSFVCSE